MNQIEGLGPFGVFGSHAGDFVTSILKTPAAGHRRTPKHQAQQVDFTAGAAGRLHGGFADQNRPITAVTVAVSLACQATVCMTFLLFFLDFESLGTSFFVMFS